MVAVAQLVEPRIVIPVVVGSSPISHPKLDVSRSLRRADFSHGQVVAGMLIASLTGKKARYGRRGIRLAINSAVFDVRINAFPVIIRLVS